MKQKTALLAIVVAMLVFAILQARGGLFGTKPRDVRSAAFLGEVAAELNKQLPKTIDRETEITSVTGLEGIFVYNYRLINRVASEVDPSDLVATLKPDVATAACAAPETRQKFLDQGITLRYSYADRDGNTIVAFDVALNDCAS